MNTQRKKFLAELKRYGIYKNIPNITEKNAEFLHILLRIKKASSVLEIGTANGYSTIWLADAIESAPSPRYLGIDVSEPSFNQAVENIRKQGLESFVELRFGNALEILPTITETFDVVFLDARKAYYHEFWQKIQPLLKADSLVIVDDVLQFPEKTKIFWEMIQSQTEFDYSTIPMDEDDGVMILVRK